jgi:hypothetical protein
VTSYLSSRKALTLVGSASPVGPLPELTYVREYVPQGTSRLVQQLSLVAPQSLRPGPSLAQLGGGEAGLAPPPESEAPHAPESSAPPLLEEPPELPLEPPLAPPLVLPVDPSRISRLERAPHPAR